MESMLAQPTDVQPAVTIGADVLDEMLALLRQDKYDGGGKQHDGGWNQSDGGWKQHDGGWKQHDGGRTA